MVLTLLVSYLDMIRHLEEQAEQREVSETTERASAILPGGNKGGQKTKLENCLLFC